MSNENNINCANCAMFELTTEALQDVGYFLRVLREDIMREKHQTVSQKLHYVKQALVGVETILKQPMLVGTGNTPAILSYYESCGFKKSHIIKHFFTDNYDHPIFEDGIQLIDMVYLKKIL